MEDTDLLPLTFTTLGVAALDVVNKIERNCSAYRSNSSAVTSERKRAMESVCLGSLFDCFETLLKYCDPILYDASAPAFFVFGNTFDPNLIVRLSFTVCPVKRTSADAQIDYSVVGFYAVDVIDHPVRPNPMMECPTNAMCVIKFVIDADDPVAKFMNPTGFFADMLGAIAATSNPRESTRLLIVR